MFSLKTNCRALFSEVEELILILTVAVRKIIGIKLQLHEEVEDSAAFKNVSDLCLRQDCVSEQI